MVGIPGAGKSTFIKQHPVLKHLPVVSTDHYVEQYAKEQKKTYTEVFNEYMPNAVKLMMENVNNLKASSTSMVWDQTSTTINSRKKKFKALPGYEHVCVWVKNPPMAVLQKRLKNRPGKVIPNTVIDDMLDGFEKPTLEEGFKEIWIVDHHRGIMKCRDVITEYTESYSFN